MLNSVLNVKALVGAFNQEKALVGAFSVIVQLCQLIVCSTDLCHLVAGVRQLGEVDEDGDELLEDVD